MKTTNPTYHQFDLTLMKKETNPLVTLHLQPLVKSLLGVAHYVTIEKEVAEILLLHTRNEHTCHIQFTSDIDVDLYGRFIDEPVLWEFGAWVASSERVLRGRIRSQKQREERFVLEANIIRVAKHICRMTSVDYEFCKLQARKWLLENSPKIKAVGCNKLYTNVNEIPS